MEGRQIDVRRELDRLRVEVEELRASRLRLVLAADADRRLIERALHDGVHQRLVTLAVRLQLAEHAAGSDPGAANTLLEEMRRDVQDALDATARLAQRVHPASLRPGDLGALLRSAATGAEVTAVVDVSAGSSQRPEAVMTIYVCWLDMLARARGETSVRIDVRERADALTFEITGDEIPSKDLDVMRDRVEALDGRLTFASIRGGGTRVCGTLPLAR